MALKRFKVFYGWWIVGAVVVISAYVAGVVFFGFTAIFEPIAAEFGWTYAQVSIAASMRGLETTFVSPLVGFLVDRWGPRKLIFGGVAFIGLGLLLLSRISSLWMLYAVFMLIMTGTSGCTGVVPIAAVGFWFRKRVTGATGIAVSGSAIGGLLVPLVARMVDVFDWRMAMAILGVGALVILLPLSLLVRHKPEQYGYLPDGEMNENPTAGESVTAVQSNEVDVGTSQALKSSVFWYIALSLTCHMLVLMAVITHVMPYLSSIGIPRTTSSLVASAIPLMSLCGRLSFGWFGDKFDKRWVTALGFVLIVVGVLLFAYVTNAGTWLLIPFVIFIGIGYGGPVPMMPALLREYFGRERLGTFLGIAMGVMAIGMMAGPPFVGWIFDRFGSYQYAWFALAALAFAGMVGLLATPSVSQARQTAGKP